MIFLIVLVEFCLVLNITILNVETSYTYLGVFVVFTFSAVACRFDDEDETQTRFHVASRTEPEAKFWDYISFK